MAYKVGIRQSLTMVALAMRGKENGVPEELVALVDYAAKAGLPLEQLADMLSVSRTAIRGWMQGHEVAGSSRAEVATLTRVLGIGVAFGLLPAPASHFEPIMKLLRRAVELRNQLDEMTEEAASLRIKYELPVSPEVAATYADEAEEEAEEEAETEAEE